MKEAQLFTNSEFQLYNEVLDLLEDAYRRRGQYQRGDPSQERTRDVLVLNFTKVVNDCRAILLLARSGFYIQAGILARSTGDACNMMMHITFEGDDATLVKQWLAGQGAKHWTIVRSLNSSLEPEHQLDTDAYEKSRRRMDDFVHGNYDSLKLYPAQAPGPTPLDASSFRELTFWKHLLYLYLFSCLLVVESIVPELEEKAKSYLDQLESM